MVEQIREAGIVLDGEVEGLAVVDVGDGGEVPGSIFVQFVHGDPDLKIKGPVVPG